MRRLALAAVLLTATAAGAAEPPATLTQGQVLRGRFVQERHLTGFERPVRSEGTFVLVPGRGLVWRVDTPFQVTTVITPAGLVQSTGGAETVRLAASRLPFLSRLYTMLGGALAGDWAALESDFRVERDQADKSGQTLTLAARRADDAAMPIKAIRLRVNHLVEEVDVVKPGGDYDHLSFADQVLSSGPPRPDEAALLDSAGR